MRYWILVLIILVNYSCEKCSCEMIRNDVPTVLYLIDTVNNVVIDFDTYNLIGPNFDKNPFAPAPKIFTDSLQKMYNKGFVRYKSISRGTKYVDCDDCYSTLKYDKNNECRKTCY